MSTTLITARTKIVRVPRRQRPNFETVLRMYKEIYESPARAQSPTYTELVTTDEDEAEYYIDDSNPIDPNDTPPDGRAAEGSR